MKKLLLVFLLALPIASLHAQNLTDDGKDISIKLTGGKTWDDTKFQIDIEKKGQSVFIKYSIKEKFDFAEIDKDSVYQALKVNYQNAIPKSEEKQMLNARLLKKMDQYRHSYQDSITVNIEHYMVYKPILKHLALANKKMFEGGYPDGLFDGDFLFCDITYNGHARRLIKDSPLSLSSPLLYTFLKETLKIGRESQCKSVLVIDKDFEYMF
ncbi:hypothetical protein FO440_01335 [Mucilaginibacter corticis]|uniref:Uncharacterized protein n=1 Tax=Mucilaginibacter corticis TaxID=2597670 RepID=A0A556MST0_9SPHI|nr:hypothetical protein [Mucilaginibacter corticis]TSJ42858.1 hypothetical protein FO440_01335 [Mucilaginibacter corticis]